MKLEKISKNTIIITILIALIFVLSLVSINNDQKLKSENRKISLENLSLKEELKNLANNLENAEESLAKQSYSEYSFSYDNTSIKILYLSNKYEISQGGDSIYVQAIGDSSAYLRFTIGYDHGSQWEDPSIKNKLIALGNENIRMYYHEIKTNTPGTLTVGDVPENLLLVGGVADEYGNFNKPITVIYKIDSANTDKKEQYISDFEEIINSFTLETY